MEKKRIVFLDYLRTAACFLVVMVHSNESFYGTDGIPVVSEDQRLWMAIWDGISRISVPLFIMTSSYLLVPMKETMSWGEFFKLRFTGVCPHESVLDEIYLRCFPVLLVEMNSLGVNLPFDEAKKHRKSCVFAAKVP